MHLKREPVFVQAFHYDYSTRDPKEASGIGVQLHKFKQDELPEGVTIPEGSSIMRVEIPFEFITPQAPLAISGLMYQTITISDFTGEPEELSPDTVKKMSRPIIETIETLTYQITTVTLDHALNLNFVPKEGKLEDIDNIDE